MIIALTFLIGVFSSFTQTEAFSVGSCARTPIIANFDATKVIPNIFILRYDQMQKY